MADSSELCLTFSLLADNHKLFFFLYRRKHCSIKLTRRIGKRGLYIQAQSELLFFLFCAVRQSVISPGFCSFALHENGGSLPSGRQAAQKETSRPSCIKTISKREQDVMKNSHSRGSVKERSSDQSTFPESHYALILRLRESEPDLADSMVFQHVCSRPYATSGFTMCSPLCGRRRDYPSSGLFTPSTFFFATWV